MQIEYCEGCKTKLTEANFKTGQAVWINNQAYCKDCSVKVAQPKASATRSGTRPTPVGTGRRTPGQHTHRLSTPGGTPKRSGMHRAPTATDLSKLSGKHPRPVSPHAAASQNPSMMLVSVIGAVVGVVLAVLVIMLFFR